MINSWLLAQNHTTTVLQTTQHMIRKFKFGYEQWFTSDKLEIHLEICTQRCCQVFLNIKQIFGRRKIEEV